MREILFRGKRIDNSEWAYGDLITLTDKEDICGIKEISLLGIKHLCDKNTVGQYTGLTDKNGKKIFEGDILEFSDRLVVVFFHSHLGCWDSNFLKFTNKENGRDDMSPLNWDCKSKVVGNIHDNPELLKKEE